jgi:hypothetical protein
MGAELRSNKGLLSKAIGQTDRAGLRCDNAINKLQGFPGSDKQTRRDVKRRRSRPEKRMALFQASDALDLSTNPNLYGR